MREKALGNRPPPGARLQQIGGRSVSLAALLEFFSPPSFLMRARRRPKKFHARVQCYYPGLSFSMPHTCQGALLYAAAAGIHVQAADYSIAACDIADTAIHSFLRLDPTASSEA